jgi:hypothetical protein
LETIKNELIDEFFINFRPQNMTFSGTKNLQLFNISYEVSNFTMSEFGMDYDNSQIYYQADKPNIVMNFTDLVTTLDMNFNITAEPRFYEDIGTGKFSFEFSKMLIGLGISTVDGAINFELQSIDAVYKGGDTSFNGTGDLSFALDKATSLIDAQMSSNANTTIATFVNLILPTINGALSSAGCQANVTSSILINMCVDAPPKFTDDDVIILFRGESSLANETFPWPEQRQIPYVIDPVATDLQVYISDYTLNSTIWAAYESDLLDFDIRYLNETTQTPITAETIRILFPSITTYMDATTPLSIRAKAVDNPIPNLTIQDGETVVIARAEISFATIDANGGRQIFLEIVSNVTLEVDFEIQAPFKFITDIKKMRIRAEELSLDTYDLTNIADLNSIVGTVSGLARNYINRILSGYTMKEFDLGPIRIDVQQTTLIEKDRYIYGDMSPHFIHNTEKFIFDTSKVERVSKPAPTYEDKVNAMANLLKLTPLYSSIQEYKKNIDMYQNLNNLAGMGQRSHDFEPNEGMPLEREFAENQF